MQQVIRTLAAHAAFAPDKPAILMPGQFITFRMLVDGINSVQTSVAGLGLQREKPIGILVDHPARHLIIALGLIASGFSISSLRPDLIPPAQAAGLDVFVTDGGKYALPTGATVFRADEHWFTKPRSRQVEVVSFDHRRIVRIVFSSGSTGRPKPIGWTAPVLRHRIEQTSRFRSILSNRSICVYGMSASGFHWTLGQLVGGRTMCFAPHDEILEFAQLYQVSGIMCTHSQLRTLLNLQQQKRLDVNFEVVSLGCGALTRELQSEIRNSFGTKLITSSYAATEFGYAAISAGNLLARSDSIGNCFAPLAQIRILDENGKETPPGQVGRVFVSSGSIGASYAGNLDVSEADVPDAVSTGDLGYIDDNGLFFLTGRANEVINAGGASFDPEVIEAVLRRMPGLTDVAAIRIALPGAAPEPWLAVTSGADVQLEAVHRWVAANLSGELASVCFARLVRMDEIPRTGTGKVARQKLRDRLMGAEGANSN